MGVSSLEIEFTDWSKFSASHGTPGAASAVGGALRRLIQGVPPSEAEALWKQFEGVVFCQGEVFSVAEPVMRVLVHALGEDIGKSARIVALELMFFIANGGPSPAPLADPQLVEWCRSLARQALVVIVRDHIEGTVTASDLLEVLCDEEELRHIAALQRLKSGAAS